MDMRFLSTKIHGAIDYIVGITLILSPMVFGFQSASGPSVVIPVILGAGVIAYSLLTQYEWSAFKIIPMKYHLVLDVIGSILVIIAPFVFSFVYQSPNEWLPNVLAGIGLIAVVLFSENSAYQTTEIH
jgi:hypothetical protein